MFGVVPVSERIVEAYIGEYASGKSEIAVNRAVDLKKEGRCVTLVDLDLVEPFYTLRPIKRQLTETGIYVVAWETSETMGLGEAGSLIKPEMRWVLRRPGDIILDIGYGVEGAKVLNLIEGAADNKNLQVFVVLNIGRPMTDNVKDIVEYVKELGIVHGLINNSHLGDDTSVDFVQQGAKVITEAALVLGLPVIATYIDRKFEFEINSKIDIKGNPIRLLDRYMTNTFW
ncbi:MAG: hypothetical protein CVV03_11135 [Firmicutes bacterium HGW-Firmicutes-8]|nr:MAG: hypothetical protein CVV03_11135 [Firmicutes bacterium HGW-Firmicutes-8]